LIKQTVSDSSIRLGHSSSLKNTLKILDFGFSTLVRKGTVAKGLRRQRRHALDAMKVRISQYFHEKW
jgi:hypothetical protein